MEMGAVSGESAGSSVLMRVDAIAHSVWALCCHGERTE